MTLRQNLSAKLEGPLTRRAALVSITTVMGGMMGGCLGLDTGLGTAYSSGASARSPLMDEPSLLVATTRRMVAEKAGGEGLAAPFFTADRGKEIGRAHV